MNPRTSTTPSSAAQQKARQSGRATMNLAIAAMTALLGAPAAFGQPGQFAAGGPPGEPEFRHGADRFGRLVEFLELTPEQEEAWEAAHEAHRASIEPVFEQMRANHEALESALEVEQPDALEVGQLVIASRDLRDEIGEAKEDLELTLEGILDAEQLTRWEAWKEARPERPRGPRDRGGPREGRRGSRS